MKINQSQRIKIFLVMTILISFGLKAQSLDLDSLEYITAEVRLVEREGSPCHITQAHFVFEVVKHLKGPAIAKNKKVFAKNLRGSSNGDAIKILDELFYCGIAEDSKANTLIINFTYNPRPKFPVSNYGTACSLRHDYFDYGVSYIRWAVRKDRQADMIGLDAFMQSKYEKKFHLMTERDRKFVFEHNNKKMIAFKMYQEWKLAEIK